ncbi:GNAT family N-acetyltransferase [Streptomyces capparidis]
MVRAGAAADAEAVCEVFLAARAEAMPYLPRLHTDEETLAWFRHVVLPGQRVWVAVGPGAGDVLGFAAVEGEMLNHLYVRPDVQGRGVGSALLGAVRDAGWERLALRVFQRNTRARAFYERHGFRAVDADDGSGNEENEPDLAYQWPHPS